MCPGYFIFFAQAGLPVLRPPRMGDGGKGVSPVGWRDAVYATAEFAALGAAGRDLFVTWRLRAGPAWLGNPEVAAVVREVLLEGAARGQYRLHAWVIIPDHVHALIAPLAPLAGIMKAIKGVSARRANRVLGRGGAAFWQDESYDHCVRNDAEFAHAQMYIARNPVKAGLADRPEAWRWSSFVEQ